ncbi:unnamed protein product [Sympodiomycopsis kandeliae]
MVNWAGLGAVLSSTARPGLVVPHLVIPSITSLSWSGIRSQGVRYIIFDKDNCLTAPLRDNLSPSIVSSYKECLEVFGPENVLIVSNSAGSSNDLNAIGAKHSSRQLYGTTVLCHPDKKPAWKCAKQAVEYLYSRQQQEGGHVMVVGDRITTDTVLAHRISDLIKSREHEAVAVLTTTLWENEGVMNTLMRKMETFVRDMLVKKGIQPGGHWRGSVQPSILDYNKLLHPVLQASKQDTVPLPQPALESQPTMTTLLISSLYSTRLPMAFKRASSSILQSRMVLRTNTFFKDGWQLILCGLREGLNRPEMVLGSRHSHSHNSTPQSQSSSRTFSSLFSTPPSSTHPRRRYYSTTPTNPRGKIPAYRWLAAFTAIAIIPIGFISGEKLHDWWYDIDPAAERAAYQEQEQSQQEAVEIKPPSVGLAMDFAALDTEAEGKEMILARRKLEASRELDDVLHKIELIQSRMGRTRFLPQQQQQQQPQQQQQQQHD